jgi:hypothetical protein
MTSEINYVRGQVDKILLSKEDLETIICGFTVEIEGVKIRKKGKELKLE